MQDIVFNAAGVEVFIILGAAFQLERNWAAGANAFKLSPAGSLTPFICRPYRFMFEQEYYFLDTDNDIYCRRQESD